MCALNSASPLGRADHFWLSVTHSRRNSYPLALSEITNHAMSKKPRPHDPFPANLREVRNTRGLTQADLARLAGMPPTSVGHFEIGSRKPSYESLQRLADALQVSMDYLLGRVRDPSRSNVVDRMWLELVKLPENDRELVMDFIKMLSKRNR